MQYLNLEEQIHLYLQFPLIEVYYQIRAYWKNFATIWDDNGKPGSSGETYTEGDINHDGTVDMDDVSALINQILSK